MVKSLERDFLDLPSEEVDKIIHSQAMSKFEKLIDDVPECSDECEILDKIENGKETE